MKTLPKRLKVRVTAEDIKNGRADGRAVRGRSPVTGPSSSRRAWVAVVVEDGCTLGIAVEGEAGYYRTNYPRVARYDEAQRWADAMNARMGLTPREAWDIQASSIRAQHDGERAERVRSTGTFLVT